MPDISEAIFKQTKNANDGKLSKSRTETKKTAGTFQLKSESLKNC